MMNPTCLAFIYRQYCQSICLYGLELVTLSNRLLGQLDVRQAISIKLSLGLSKYFRSTALLEAMEICSIKELYLKHKLLFYNQVIRNGVTAAVFEELSVLYRGASRVGHSYFNHLAGLGGLLGHEVDRQTLDQAKLELRSKFSATNLGLVDSIRVLLKDWWDNPNSQRLLALFLRVEFGVGSRTELFGGEHGGDRVLAGSFLAGLDDEST